jgi:polysaccharide deacetylase 2 family uncharacterized protein YibQ
MPKRKARASAASPRALITLAIAALVLFLLGESFLLVRSDSGRITLRRTLGIGDRATITRIVGQHARRAFAVMGVPIDSLRESVVEGRPAAVQWRIGFAPEQSLIKANFALTHFIEELGARVLSGRERIGKHGETVVTLVAGLPGMPTHEITLVRAAPPGEASALRRGRLAIVAYGFGDDEALAASFAKLPVPFAMAIVPGAKASASMFRAAHSSQREVVLHLPLEPINYPQVDPGPGTVLVTMRPARIASVLQHDLDQARPVVAVANHMGSLATQDMTVMGAIYHELRRAELPFIHLSPAAGAVCKSLAADLGVAYDEPGAVIDDEARQTRPKALERRWKEILAQARTREHLVVWVRATPLSRGWLPGAVDRKQLEGVDLVPLSSLLRKSGGI